MVLYETVDILKIGIFSIGSYLAMITLAIIIGGLIAVKEAKKRKIDINKFLLLYPFLILGAYIGARVFYYFGFSKEVSLFNLLININYPGGVLYGAIIGAVVFGWIYIFIRKENFLKYCDSFALSLALGLFIGRIGCVLNGCCHGIHTTLPFGLFYIYNGMIRYPTQTISSLFALCLFVYLVYLNQRKLKNGILFMNAVLIYSIFRFLIEFIRVTPKIFLGLSLAQWISLGLFVFVILWRFKNEKRS